MANNHNIINEYQNKEMAEIKETLKEISNKLDSKVSWVIFWSIVGVIIVMIGALFTSSAETQKEDAEQFRSISQQLGTIQGALNIKNKSTPNQ